MDDDVVDERRVVMSSSQVDGAITRSRRCSMVWKFTINLRVRVRIRNCPLTVGNSRGSVVRNCVFYQLFWVLVLLLINCANVKLLLCHRPTAWSTVEVPFCWINDLLKHWGPLKIVVSYLINWRSIFPIRQGKLIRHPWLECFIGK